MGWYQWLLFLHVAAAFATVASGVLFGALLVVTRRPAPAAEALPVRRFSSLANQLWNIGGGAVLVFGIWLALHVGYSLLDGWILAALVVYLIATVAGGFVNLGYQRAFAATGEEADRRRLALRSGRSVFFHAVLFVTLAALLVVMIYKPGAG